MFCLKQRCIKSIGRIICLESTSLLTRDIIVSLPSVLLDEIYQSLDLDLSNTAIDVVFMLQEVISQRTFEIPNASLYQICCSSVIRKCGFLTSEDILSIVGKMNSSVLNDLTNIFQREHWCSIISKIQVERNF